MKCRFFSNGLLLAGLISLNACGSLRSAQNAQECNIGVAGKAKLVWQPYTGKVLSSGKALPKAYTAFTATGAADFFRKAAKSKSIFRWQLPSTDCQEFSMEPSGTMSPGLAEKYPHLILLKGHSGHSDLRLDWNGIVIRGQIIASGHTWFIEPYFFRGADVYLLFNKDDAPYPKQAFE